MRKDYEEPRQILLIIEVLMNLSEPSGSLRHGGAITGIEKVHRVFEAAAGVGAAAGIANGGISPHHFSYK